MLHYKVDEDGIASIIWDMQDRPMNVLSPEARTVFVEALDKAIADPAVRGLLISSARDEFIAGADLTFVQTLRGADPLVVMQRMSPMRDALRRLEKSGKPSVAAIGGTALGGGLELCLACSRRIAADRDDAIFGLPEVTLGLLPGAGGTQRLVRMLGVEKALPLMLEGRRLNPQAAFDLGVVDELAPREALLERGRAWLLAQDGPANQPWDRPGFKLPGAAPDSPVLHRFFTQTGARVQAEARDLQPAPGAILSCVFEGCRLPMDQALAVEFSYFVSLVRGEVAQNTIRTMFFGMNEARKLAARPKGPAKLEINRLGVLGAGLMGSGLAEVASLAGLDVALIDRDEAAARAGKERVQASLDKQVVRGRLAREVADAAIARIDAGAQYERLAGSQAVIEAVFEDRAVKADVTRRAIEAAGSDILLASNTSKIAITGLAQNSPRPDRFIGMHFFSPVPRMQLLEIIRGEKTSDETLAHALDLAKIMKKLPIVVNDGPGFYTSRCVGAYLNEGLIMLADGVPAAMIENCGRAAGMPVGPITLADEIGLDLMLQVRRQEQADLDKPAGAEFPVLARMVDELGRRGRKGGGGFYDYADGGKAFWARLGTAFPTTFPLPEAASISRRLLHVQALEAARCFDAGVIESARDADIGSILGWGFAKHTGGVASYMDTIGLARFVDDCRRYEADLGSRYAVPPLLECMATERRGFHDTTCAA